MAAAAACLQELPAQQVQQLLDQVLQRDLQPLLHQPPQQLGDAGQQFVMSRALMLGAELQEAASARQKEHLLQAAAAAGPAGISCTCCRPSIPNPHTLTLMHSRSMWSLWCSTCTALMCRQLLNRL
jgi:hypothetical protein